MQVPPIPALPHGMGSLPITLRRDPAPSIRATDRAHQRSMT